MRFVRSGQHARKSEMLPNFQTKGYDRGKSKYVRKDDGQELVIRRADAILSRFFRPIDYN